ncbi:acyl carrier protein [Hansschlegelia zhihuaiae]|uniref:Acyl carrier protein n=1 Tax=Hansschlegelia zhihuaiae TaxID=405005 RepID=A0A4Q0MLA8_9HYPH|nr:acyl carrier protein [Hansschlegelia zhihuaiae]RXF74464.1 acyl carrier protein [Hansschlegelia zhihuaiae]
MNDVPTVTLDAVREWMIGYVSSTLEIPREVAAPDATFDTYGLDSAEGVIMAGVIEEEFGIEIDPAVFFEDPTINGVAAVVVRLRREQTGG